MAAESTGWQAASGTQNNECVRVLTALRLYGMQGTIGPEENTMDEFVSSQRCCARWIVSASMSLCLALAAVFVSAPASEKAKIHLPFLDSDEWRYEGTGLHQGWIDRRDLFVLHHPFAESQADQAELGTDASGAGEQLDQGGHAGGVHVGHAAEVDDDPLGAVLQHLQQRPPEIQAPVQINVPGDVDNRRSCLPPNALNGRLPWLVAHHDTSL